MDYSSTQMPKLLMITTSPPEQPTATHSTWLHMNNEFTTLTDDYYGTAEYLPSLVDAHLTLPVLNTATTRQYSKINNCANTQPIKKPGMYPT